MLFVRLKEASNPKHSSYFISAEIRVDDNLWILGNVDYMGFFRTNYDDLMWGRLITQLNTDHLVGSSQFMDTGNHFDIY